VAGGETVQSTVATIGQLLKANQETSAKIEELAGRVMPSAK